MHDYIPPLWQQVGITLLRLAAAVLVLLVGEWAGRRSDRARNAAAGVGTAVAVLATLSQVQPVIRYTSAFARPFVGLNTLACVGVLLLLGAAWHVKGRVFTQFTVASLAGIALMLVLLFTSGWVMWRYLRPGVRAHFPDAQGLMQQKTALTCAPASAAMLLHRYGIRASEGEMAELACTGILGTDDFFLARAVDRVAAGRGMHSRLRWLDYQAAMRLRRPFVAGMDDPAVGGHALLVTRLEPKKAGVVDPLVGQETPTRRQDFEAMWMGGATYVIPRME